VKLRDDVEAVDEVRPHAVDERELPGVSSDRETTERRRGRDERGEPNRTYGRGKSEALLALLASLACRMRTASRPTPDPRDFVAWSHASGPVAGSRPGVDRVRPTVRRQRSRASTTSRRTQRRLGRYVARRRPSLSDGEADDQRIRWSCSRCRLAPLHTSTSSNAPTQ